MTPDPEEQLRREVSVLPVEDILALCYTFQHRRERLRLYLDVLRRSGGERAQFASCLICFDLARQGDDIFQQEFVFLADSMRALAQKKDLVQNLVGGDPYLSFLWDLCQAQLSDLDPRFAPAELTPEEVEVANVELLSDEDFADLLDFEIPLEDSTLRIHLDQAVEEFLGGEMGMPIYDPDAGFRLGTSEDVERIERFLQQLDSLRNVVPLSRGFRALALLFYATHMRSKSLFGAPNPRKQALLRAGIAEFVVSGPQVWEVIGILNPLHAEDDVWTKIAEILLDYMRWLALYPDRAQEGVAAYDAVGRLLGRQPILGDRRRGLRE